MLFCIFAAILIINNVIANELNGSASGEAVGNDASVVTNIIIEEGQISGSAISEATASDGQSATAIATVLLNIEGGGSAFANAVVYAISKVGETIYIKAIAFASIMSDGSSHSYALSSITNKNDIFKKMPETISGYVFGDSDFDRYCLWKSQMNSSDRNISIRAKRNIDDMLYENYYPLNMSSFEERIRIQNNIICKSGNLSLKDRIDLIT